MPPKPSMPDSPCRAASTHRRGSEKPALTETRSPSNSRLALHLARRDDDVAVLAVVGQHVAARAEHAPRDARLFERADDRRRLLLGLGDAAPSQSPRRRAERSAPRSAARAPRARPSARAISSTSASRSCASDVFRSSLHHFSNALAASRKRVTAPSPPTSASPRAPSKAPTNCSPTR